MTPALTGSITVVVPVYDNPSGLRRTLTALANRADEHPALEVIVVDDGSTDATPAITIEMLKKFERSRVISTSNRGASAARNTGAAAAAGEYLVFLDANDEPLSGWLACFGLQVGERPGIVHCDPVITDPGVGSDYGFLLPGCFAVDRRVFGEVSGYDEKLRFAENTDLVERVHEYCARYGLEVRHAHEALLAVHDISDPRRYDAQKVDAMIYLLNRDERPLSRDPERKARLARVGSVSAVRTGQSKRARWLAWTAVRARPGVPRNWARLLMTVFPVVGRRRWPRIQPEQEVTG